MAKYMVDIQYGDNITFENFLDTTLYSDEWRDKHYPGIKHFIPFSERLKVALTSVHAVSNVDDKCIEFETEEDLLAFKIKYGYV